MGTLQREAIVESKSVLHEALGASSQISSGKANQRPNLANIPMKSWKNEREKETLQFQTWKGAW